MRILKRIQHRRSKKPFFIIDSGHLSLTACSLSYDDNFLYITTYKSKIKIPLKDIEEIRPGQRTDEWFKFCYNVQEKSRTRQSISNMPLINQVNASYNSCFSILVPRKEHSILPKSYDFYAEDERLFQKLFPVLTKNIEECKKRFQVQSHHNMIETFYNDHIDEVIDVDEFSNNINEKAVNRFYRFLKHINLEFDRKYLNSILFQKMSKEEILDLMYQFDSRPVFNFLFSKYSICKSKLMSRDGLSRFFEIEQQEKLTKEQLDGLMAKYSNIEEDLDDEPGKEQYLNKRAFYRLMDSDEWFDLFKKEHREVCQDMTQPLNDYFIASSHNSYISGNQFNSPSSYEMYRQILLTGCRCVEIDVWDETTESGETHPVVYHGHTMTTKIQLEGVLQTIMDVAFVHSNYPVIISVENRCKDEKNHKKMAHLMRRIFKDRLYVEPVSGDRFPSPEELQRKIFIKCSKNNALHRTLSENEDVGGIGDDFVRMFNLGFWEFYMLPSDRRREYIQHVKDTRFKKMERLESVMKIKNDIDEDDLKYLKTRTMIRRPILRIRRRNPIEQQQRIQHLQQQAIHKFKFNRLRKKSSVLLEGTNQALENRLADENSEHICHSDDDSDDFFDDDHYCDHNYEQMNDEYKSLVDDDIIATDGLGNTKTKWDKSFSSLINYFETKKFHTLDDCLKDFQFYHMISRDEKKSLELIETDLERYREFTKTNMVRIYPAGWRQNSSNYCPMDHWNAGCQLVALNYQRYSMPMFLNKALFSLNGESGYVLKPKYLRRNRMSTEDHESVKSSKCYLKIHILCGQFWNHFDWKKLGLKIIIRVYTGGRKFRQSTQTIKNGFNPVWNEAFEFELDQHELTFVHFTLTNCDKFFGHYLISFPAMRKGYRHISLYDSQYCLVEYARIYLNIDYWNTNTLPSSSS